MVLLSLGGREVVKNQVCLKLMKLVLTSISIISYGFFFDALHPMRSMEIAIAIFRFVSFVFNKLMK